MKYLSLGLLLTSSLIIGHQHSGEAAQINLIRNSSFEVSNVDPQNGYITLGQGSNAIDGWEVTRGGIDYMGSVWNAANGLRSIDLNASPGFGGIKQIIATIPNKTYLLSFSLAANPGISGMTTVRVEKSDVNPTNTGINPYADFDVDPGKMPTNSLNWDTTALWEFVATSEQTSLEFFTWSSSSPYGGPAIDNISLTEVNQNSIPPANNLPQGIPETTPLAGLLVFGVVALSLSNRQTY